MDDDSGIFAAVGLCPGHLIIMIRRIGTWKLEAGGCYSSQSAYRAYFSGM
jgi:hypothetical protein